MSRAGPLSLALAGLGAAAALVGSGYLGSKLAWRAVATPDGEDFIHVGPWMTSAVVASPEADAFTRAFLAVNGLLGLPKTETMYFVARTDDAGRPLSSDYVYEIVGVSLPSRWWALTLYNGDNFLIPNDYDRYSVKSTAIEAEADGTIRVTLSRAERAGNWIPTGDGQDMRMSIRMYNPDPSVSSGERTPDLFSIKRVGEAK